ncbi:MAG TPA: Gfo/Idh/MocA family oxidoreductase [Verrucomicrobiota bacterium]|nr:Gfo/Idh/MocA family oxidoreductase [Verrucomicrobiota bacterium]
MDIMNQAQSGAGEFNRRNFLKGGSFATVATMLGGVPLFAQTTNETVSATKPAGPKVKCAVIGLGPWGRELLDQLGRVPQAEIAAICDNYAAFLRRSAAKAPGAQQVADYNAVLDNKEITAVIVATPTQLHKDIVIAALKAGKNVYCEVPLAHTVEDARAIALAAKDSPQCVFQAGLQLRSDPQRHFLLPFIRSGALGRPILSRAQWHKRQSWRVASPNPEREKSANWRLEADISTGLVGEIGIHALDQTGWLFLNATPVSVTGVGSIRLWDDGRKVPDTVQLLVEYPGGVRLIYDATLGSSFDAEYENFYGSDATIMIREQRAWMFKEVEAPLLGWEPYANKETFHKETGIALVADASKQTAGGDAHAEPPPPLPALYCALEAFLANCADSAAAVEDFSSMFDANDKQALAEYLLSIKFKPAAGHKEGYAATVLAIKANESVVRGERIELRPEWFELG